MKHPTAHAQRFRVHQCDIAPPPQSRAAPKPQGTSPLLAVRRRTAHHFDSPLDAAVLAVCRGSVSACVSVRSAQAPALAAPDPGGGRGSCAAERGRTARSRRGKSRSGLVESGNKFLGSLVHVVISTPPLPIMLDTGVRAIVHKARLPPLLEEDLDYSGTFPLRF
ncbi:hypothetical protein NDU88_006879 [Pleurodeles waltl]|uniref:Uncharacterized protein n=1 Tax=Pleurodeles waltl TaxID=8319 RepID=A0AAV7LRQ2_PLEWA|nr:hypothetical protein NDU88_006879 [Pleurodeles waltl]